METDILIRKLLNSKVSIIKNILHWYHHEKRELPWRKKPEPYRIWISEVMLQQTRVETVIPYYQRFIRKYPSVKKLAKAKLEQVLKLWEGLGYYRRAMYLHESAKLIVKDHGGKIPDDYNKLLLLPGIGPYTAGAVMSIAFQQAYPAVDGNVKRVCSRLISAAENFSGSQSGKWITTLLRKLIPENNPSDFNQSMMELGAKICTPRSPRCGVCPLRKICRARRLGNPERFPVVQGRKTPMLQPVAVAVIHRNGRYLITRRPAGVILPNLWEFPGGKILPGETPEEACTREVYEETKIRIRVSRLLARFTHHYSHYSVDLHFFECRHVSGNVQTEKNIPFRWARPGELRRYPFPKSTLQIVEQLCGKNN